MKPIKCKNEAEAREKWHRAIEAVPVGEGMVITAESYEKYRLLSLIVYMDYSFDHETAEMTHFVWGDNDD